MLRISLQKSLTNTEIFTSLKLTTRPISWDTNLLECAHIYTMCWQHLNNINNSLLPQHIGFSTSEGLRWIKNQNRENFFDHTELV